MLAATLAPEVGRSPVWVKRGLPRSPYSTEYSVVVLVIIVWKTPCELKII